MTTLVAMGAFCPVEGIAEPLRAAGWRVTEPQEVAAAAAESGAASEAAAGPAVAVLEDGLGRLPDLLAASPSAKAVILHVSREEAIAAALCDGLDPTAALDRWRASTLEQTALFRRMRERIVLVARRRFEAAPAAVLGCGAPGASLPPWRVDPLALALAVRLVALSPAPDAAASMLAACVREEDRIDVPLDAQAALAAWRRHAALAAGAESAAREAEALQRERDAARDAAAQAATEAAEREGALRDEIGLLRERINQMQADLEATRRQGDARRDEAAREAQAAVATAEARAAAALRRAEEAQATLAARDKALAEREAALKAAEADRAALEADLAQARGAAEREQALRDEIGLLREQVTHMQAALETAWTQREEGRAEAARDAQAAEARAAGALRRVEEAQATLAARDKALAERDEALKAAQARQSAGDADLAKARETLAMRDRTLAEREAALKAAEAGRATAAADLAKAREALAARDKALAERDAALKAALEGQAARDGDLAKTREVLAARDAALAEATRRLTAAEKAGAEAERLRAIEASQAEEIALLREQLGHLQAAFEAAWLQKEETRANASRQPAVHAGLTMPVDLGVAAQPAP